MPENGPYGRVRTVADAVLAGVGLVNDLLWVAHDVATCRFAGHDWHWRRVSEGPLVACRRCGRRP